MSRILSIIVGLSYFSAWAAGQGFTTMGMFSKKEVPVKRLLPATVNLNKKHIRVEARIEPSVKNAADMAPLLKTKLTVMIQKDPRFIIDEARPETILRFAITNYYTESWVTPAQGNTPASTAYRGKFEVAYQAVEAGTSRMLDSENLSVTAGFDLGNSHSTVLGSFGMGSRSKDSRDRSAASKSENETRDQLVDGIVLQMGRRVSPIEEPFDAPLPVKKLEPISGKAQSHLWGSVQEAAEKMPKFPKPDDDSYRLYLIALAKEAQSYELTAEANDRELGKRPDISAEDAAAEFDRAQRLMDEARKLFRDIIASNPKEKVFRDGDARTQEALTIYEKITRYRDENAAHAATAVPAHAPAAPAVQSASRQAPPPIAPPPVGQTAAPSQASPLDQVITFCRSAIDAATIREYIASKEFVDDAKATSYKFVYSRDVLPLKQACGDSALVYQKSIIQRLSPPAPKPAAATSAPAAKKP
jgi:hypothetical protein